LRAFYEFQSWLVEGASVNAFLAGSIALFLMAPTAFAESSTARTLTLSIDQQNKLSEIITNKTRTPLGPTDFTIAVGTTVPSTMSLQPLPPDAEALAPQLREASYFVVEELVVIVDSNSRKIVAVMQRMRRQDTTGSRY
jgi:Protein of unknown function (DUF1236)